MNRAWAPHCGIMFKSWKEAALKEYPRLSLGDKFKFSCHKGLSCFTKCCADVNIFLTPYDVLRMKKALKLDSGQFLKEYTVPPLLADGKLPLVLLKMREDERKTCPFVTKKGCSIYADRPWACRMFPLGIASSKTADNADGEEFFFIAEEGFNCAGLKEGDEQTVMKWWQDQGIDTYERINEPYKELTLHRYFREGKELGPSKTQMFYLTCYDLDRFRRLIVQSSFFNRFDVEEEVIERVKTDEEALLDFGIAWLRFSLFGEDTIKIKCEVAEDMKKALGDIPQSEQQ